MIKNDKELEKFEKDIFNIHKYLLTLTVTIFGSSIALATNKNINNYFLIGEFLIFISSILGLFLVLAYKKNKELDYVYRLKEETKQPSIEFLESCKKQEKENQSGILYSIFKTIKYEKIFEIFVLTLIFGMFFILISLVFQANVENLKFIFCFLHRCLQ